MKNWITLRQKSRWIISVLLLWWWNYISDGTSTRIGIIYMNVEVKDEQRGNMDIWRTKGPENKASEFKNISMLVWGIVSLNRSSSFDPTECRISLVKIETSDFNIMLLLAVQSGTSVLDVQPVLPFYRRKPDFNWINAELEHAPPSTLQTH